MWAMRMSTVSQVGQGNIVPMPYISAIAAPRGLVVPQPEQVAIAIVISKGKIAPSTPPAALPSRCWSADSRGSGLPFISVGGISVDGIVSSRSSRWPETLCVDPLRRIAQAQQTGGGDFYKRGRATDVCP